MLFSQQSSSSSVINNLKARLLEKYLLPNQTETDMFRNVARRYAEDVEHEARLFEYLVRGFFMPATPVLIAGNKGVGLPISCFKNEYEDSMNSIKYIWGENVSIGAEGGGIGSYMGNIRSIGTKISKGGYTSGIMPFLKVMDATTMAINQGSHRRGAAAAYLHISHPEIKSFIDMRKPTGDINRRTNYIHHGIVITDEFMYAVKNQLEWHLRSPVDGSIIETVRAVDLWIQILITRVETGEPYIIYIDNINKSIPLEHREHGLFVKTSNLCSEITLPTGRDHIGNIRTAVCCLSSINIAKIDEFDLKTVVEDVLLFLDNVLQDFIDNAPEDFHNAKYAASRERSVGLGVMGWHTLLQKKMISIESQEARELNIEIFASIKQYADDYSKNLAKIKGPCLDSKYERFMNKIAIAPNASTSILNNSVSPGIDVLVSNAYINKNAVGSAIVYNSSLEELLEAKGNNTPDVWNQIIQNNGSVQHLECLTAYEKSVFKTAYEISQKTLIQLAADRTPYICQSQSLNLYVEPTIHKKELHEIHFMAWELGVKTQYYLRTKSIQRAECTACQ